MYSLERGKIHKKLSQFLIFRKLRLGRIGIMLLLPKIYLHDKLLIQLLRRHNDSGVF